MNKFPDEIWIDDDEYNDYGTTSLSWIPPERQARYIHESRVPISCGGTMEENDANALVRAIQAEELNSSNWKEIQQLKRETAAALESASEYKRRMVWLQEILVQKKERMHSLEEALRDIINQSHGEGIHLEGRIATTALTSGSAEIQIQCPIKKVPVGGCPFGCERMLEDFMKDVREERPQPEPPRRTQIGDVNGETDFYTGKFASSATNEKQG
jgi:hypothetical protein